MVRLSWNLWLAVTLALAVQHASMASAQQQMPACALRCLVAALGNSTCLPTDQACICTDTPLQASMTTCVRMKCTIRESLVAKNVSSTNCGLPVRSEQQTYISATISLLILSTVFTAQRFIYKLYSRVSLGADDWCTLVVLGSLIVSSTLNLHGLVPSGLGLDVWTRTPEQLDSFFTYFLVIAVLYFAQLALLKLSLLLFYLRVFPSRGIQLVLYATIVFDVLYGITYVVAGMLQCAPVSYFWHMWDGEHAGYCVDTTAITWSNAIISIVLDFWMLALPLSQLRSLQLNWKKKLSMAFMFFVGTFVTFVSILRLNMALKVGAINAGTTTTNPTWDFMRISIYSVVEINVGVVCACLPTTRLLFVDLFPNLFGSTVENCPAANVEAPPMKYRKGTSGAGSSYMDMPDDHESQHGIMMRKDFSMSSTRHTDEMHLVHMSNLARRA